jgi:hypothetical protein
VIDASCRKGATTKYPLPILAGRESAFVRLAIRPIAMRELVQRQASQPRQALQRGIGLAVYEHFTKI